MPRCVPRHLRRGQVEPILSSRTRGDGLPSSLGRRPESALAGPERLLTGNFGGDHDRLVVAGQRPSSLNASGLIGDGRISTRSGHLVCAKADTESAGWVQDNRVSRYRGAAAFDGRV